MVFQRFQNLTPEVQQKVWEIYEYSFPAHEKRSFADHENALEDVRFYADGVFDGEVLAGILFYWELKDYVYIEHFAIDQFLRGQNYGTRILKDFCQQQQAVLLEIEEPADEVTIKREHFYHRLGFITSKFSYTHPSYGSEYMPHTLLLMSYPNPITEAEFEQFKNTMFSDIMSYSGKAKK